MCEGFSPLHYRCNLLEEPLDSPVGYTGHIPLRLKPFEIATFILHLQMNVQ